MNAIDVIRKTMDLSEMVVGSYTKDLADADLRAVPISGMNPMALQIGHLIAIERLLVEAVQPGSCPPLPEGFEPAHAVKREEGKPVDPSTFLPVARYQELWAAQRAATKRVLDGLTEAQLEEARPGLPAFAPTVGDAMNLIGNHAMMHAGQFVAVRRQAGKPVVI